MKFNESVEDRFMEENKSIDYEEREKIWEEVAYTDSKGINHFDLYKKIKKTDLIKIYNNLFDGKLLSKIASGFELIFYFEFKQECHYLIFSKYNKTYFHIYVLKDKNKPISKSNQLIYN